METKYYVNGVEYTDLKEAEAAEAKLTAEKAKKAKESEARKADLVPITEKAQAYLKLCSENAEKRSAMHKAEIEAYNAYRAELDKFSEKHGDYRLSYKVDGDNVEFKVEDENAESIRNSFNDLRDFINNFFNLI